MKKVIEKYGIANCMIVLLCIITFAVNSLIVEQSRLYEISDHLAAAYVLNFLAGCQGILGKWGSMSFEKVFSERQIWRCFTHIYLHSGVIHLGMNLAALLVAGKYVEKKFGSTWYVVFFHVTAIIDAVITSCIFPGSELVGASAGIFAVIGIFVILLYRKQISVSKSERIYLIVFFILSLALGTESLVIHLTGLLLGVLAGLCRKVS